MQNGGGSGCGRKGTSGKGATLEHVIWKEGQGLHLPGHAELVQGGAETIPSNWQEAYV